ncbi:MAG: hypothetical protein DRH90_18130 [Deltaproteobacteria bacterium]|nr:MAG: hypothetical protein DRH90_18130 [Deltaproteobacteria bacterium]RLC10023.1 MAG: hypothetical protein DRI24_20900 [Deltaproteobacteria bacterium]
MAAKSTKDLTVCISKGDGTLVNVAPTAITSAAPAVVTATNSGIDGEMVYVSGTDMPAIDNKWWVSASVSGTEFTLLGSDTTDDTFDVTGASTDRYAEADMECLCLSSLTLNVDEPGTISVATFCDPSATIASAVQAAGTISFAGFVAIGDSDYQELLIAADDGLERVMRIALPANGYLVAPVTFSQITWDLPIDGAVGYTGTAVLSTKMVHQF